MSGAGMGAVYDVNRGLLDVRMRFEIGTDKFSVKGPAIFGIGGGVNSYEAASLLDVGFEGLFLFGVKDVASCGKKDYGFVLF